MAITKLRQRGITDQAVGSTQIENNTVAAADIAPATITTTQIAPGTIASSNIKEDFSYSFKGSLKIFLVDFLIIPKRYLSISSLVLNLPSLLIL